MGGVHTMHAQQRHARFNLIVISIALGLSAVACLILIYLGASRPVAGFGFLGVAGVLGLGGRFYGERHRGSVVMDERDVEINRKALVTCWGIEWLYWGLCCMVPYFLAMAAHGLSHTTIPFHVGWLPMAYMGAALIHVIVWSVAVLRMYYRGRGDAEE